MTPMTLNRFEGREVVDTKMKVTNAGDGLSAALEIEPVELHLRQTVQVLLECEVTRVAFENASEGDGVVRVPTLKAGRATLITSDHELHKSTVSALNHMTQKLAQAGKAEGAIPGQGTLQGGDTPEVPHDASSLTDGEWEASAGDRGAPMPVGDDALDEELDRT
jgi:hypothetical protein